MPFVSERQRRWMFARKPEMARRWAAEGNKAMRVRQTGSVTKAEAPVAQQKIVERKRKQKHLSEASAALGLAALGAKAPSYAAAAARKFPKASKPLSRIAAAAPKADKFSEHVVPVSLGVGAMGSINFARLQGQEAKAKPVVAKRDDRFIRTYGQHISPAAESAYRDLGQRKVRRYSDAGAFGALGALAASEGIGVARTPMSAPFKAAGLGLSGAGVLGAGALAGKRIAEGRSLQGRRDKIKAKGIERHRAGEYGRGRPKPKLAELSKALLPTPAVRPGGLMRTVSGKVVTRRGAIAGTGKFTPTLRRLP